MTGFALSIWILQETGSATLFGLSIAIQVIPSIFLSPLAGVVIDRWSRKTVMLLADVASACGSLAVLYLLLNDALSIWHIYALGVLSACWGTFQELAHTASTSQLVPKQYRGNANGLLQVSAQGGAIIVPVLSMVLVETFGLSMVILVDFITFVIGIISLLFVKIPPINEDRRLNKKFSFSLLVNETKFGFRYIFQHRELTLLLYFIGVTGFATGFVYVLFRPLVLEITTARELGLLVSIGGIGGFVGAIFISIWGGPKRKLDAVIGFSYIVGFSSILCGVGTSFIPLAIASFSFSFAIPIIHSCVQTIWQLSTNKEYQGRVFAAKKQVTNFTMPIAVLLSPILADYVFEPWMADGGRFSQQFGDLLPLGDGRGIGMLFVISGVLIVIFSTTAWIRSRSLGSSPESVEDKLVMEK